jgi:type I restriction enzyme S subunit
MSDVIPEGWRIENIETIANVGSSKRILQSEYVPSGVPFFRSKEAIRRSKNLPIENPLYISKKRFKELKDKHGAPKKNEILVTAVGTIGVIYLIEDIEFYFKDGNLLWIKHIDEDVNPSYLAKYLASDTCHNAIIEIAGGSSQSALTIEKLSKLEFNLPPLPEQQKIAAILSRVDDVIEKTQAQINKLKDLKTGMMQELLSPREGQAANINNPQGESKNGLHHTEFKDSPLGRIPVGWDASPLHEYCERVCVGFVGTCEKFYCEDGIPMIRTGNLKNGNLDLSNVKYVTSEFHTKEKKSQLKVGDLLIARHGSHGAACLIPEGIKEANCLNVVIVKVNKRYYQPLFLKYVFNSDVMKNSFKSKSEGSTQQVISTTEIANAVFPRPSMMEQERITGILSSIDKKIELNEAKNTQNNSIKKALMQDLLTGKVRVKVDSA